MIRLGVLSDTHGNSPSIASALRVIGEVDGYIHLGDFVSDAERIASETGKPMYAVRGNGDALAPSVYGTERVLELEGSRLMLVHGHVHEVDAYSTYAARQRALELRCCALLYGHTHIPQLVNRDGITVLNPGSTSRPRDGAKASAAVLEIENGRVRARILPL